jgi:hypothetical protein
MLTRLFQNLQHKQQILVSTANKTFYRVSLEDF